MLVCCQVALGKSKGLNFRKLAVVCGKCFQCCGIHGNKYVKSKKNVVSIKIKGSFQKLWIPTICFGDKQLSRLICGYINPG